MVVLAAVVGASSKIWGSVTDNGRPGNRYGCQFMLSVAPERPPEGGHAASRQPCYPSNTKLRYPDPLQFVAPIHVPLCCPTNISLTTSRKI